MYDSIRATYFDTGRNGPKCFHPLYALSSSVISLSSHDIILFMAVSLRGVCLGWVGLGGAGLEDVELGGRSVGVMSSCSPALHEECKRIQSRQIEADINGNNRLLYQLSLLLCEIYESATADDGRLILSNFSENYCEIVWEMYDRRTLSTVYNLRCHI